MRLVPTLALCALTLACGAAAASADGADDQCLPLSSITSLSLQQGMTTSRVRTPNVPLLNCVGNCPANAYVSSAQCLQTGTSDNGLPSWKCNAVFPGASRRERFALGNVRVQCEGCTKAGDTNVRRGSCALTYSVLTRAKDRPRLYSQHYQHHNGEASVADVAVLGLLVLSIVACCYFAARRRRYTEFDSVTGVPIGPDGKPVYGAGGAVHHYHHGGGYGSGGGGFGTGMFTGFLMGDMLGRMSAQPYGYGGGYRGGYEYGDDGDDGGGSWGGDGGIGGTDSI